MRIPSGTLGSATARGSTLTHRREHEAYGSRMTMWGIHNNQPQIDQVTNGFVAIGWDELGDLGTIGDDKHAMQARVAETYPETKQGAVPGAAGVLLKFAFRMEPGDVVVYP